MSRAALQHAPQNARTSAATSLHVGPAHDAFEQEADQAAEQVTTGEHQRVAWSLSRVGLGPVQRQCSCGGTCAECKKKEVLQRQATSSTASAAPASVSSVLSRPGSALEGGTRSFMESRFGHDFSSVRIHTDSLAAESARSVDALAYTVGEHVVFGKDQFDPSTTRGRKLLAHELAHTVQQDSSSRGIYGNLEVGSPQDASEHHADEAAESVLSDRHNNSIALSQAASSSPIIRRVAGPGKQEQPLSDVELLRILSTERAFSFSKPGAPAQDTKGTKRSGGEPVGIGVGPAAGGKAAGDAVFAAVQITDRDGKLVDRSIGRYFGGGDEHAEQQALEALKLRLEGKDLAGGQLLVVVDQDPCPPGRNNCQGLIQSFAEKFKLTPRIRIPKRASARSGALPGERAGTKSSARGIQRTDFPPVQLEDFHPSATRGSGSSTAEPEAVPPTATNLGQSQGVKSSPINEEIDAPDQLPAVPKGIGTASEDHPISVPKSVTRIGTALSLFNLLLFLARFLPDPLEKEEHKRIEAAFNKELSTSQWLERVKQLQPEVEKAEGSLFYNVVFKTIYNGHHSPSPKFDTQYTFTRVEIVSIALGTSDQSTCGKLDPPDRPNGRYGWEAAVTCTASSRVKSGGEIRRENREKENQRLAEKLRQAAAQSKPTEPKPEKPPGSTNLLPGPGAQDAPASFSPLPGAPGRSPVAEAENVIAKGKAQVSLLLARGEKLLSSSPSSDQIQAFLRDEDLWRTAATFLKNYFTDHGPDIGRSGMDELLNSDQYGGRLKQIRASLGGS